MKTLFFRSAIFAMLGEHCHIIIKSLRLSSIVFLNGGRPGLSCWNNNEIKNNDTLMK